jgi:hypothetical protein
VFFPFDKAISILAIPLSLIKAIVGITVNPFSSDFSWNLLICCFVKSNFLSLFGSWLLEVPKEYSLI